jgi:pyridoxal 5-phosphate dependent beta-lyase
VALYRPADGFPELDVASAARMSIEVVDSIANHLNLERALGPYAAGDQARQTVAAARQRLANLAGMPDGAAEFVDSGTGAVRLILEAWPLDPGDVVLVPRSEFLSNRLVLERLAAIKGLNVVEIPQDNWGRLELEFVERWLKQGQVAVVLASHVQSQRGIVQPIGALQDIVRRSNVPILLDACQAVGHVKPIEGVAAIASTSRKWLHGPRGIGIVVVREPWRSMMCASPSLHSHTRRGNYLCADPSKRLFEPAEAAVALRVGLATAMHQFEEANAESVFDHLGLLGPSLRQRLRAATPSITLGEPIEERSAIVTIRNLTSTQLRSLRQHLASNNLRIGWVGAGRAMDVERDIVRISPAPWLRVDDLDQVAAHVAHAL